MPQYFYIYYKFSGASMTFLLFTNVIWKGPTLRAVPRISLNSPTVENFTDIFWRFSPLCFGLKFILTKMSHYQFKSTVSSKGQTIFYYSVLHINNKLPQIQWYSSLIPSTIRKLFRDQWLRGRVFCLHLRH